jgi:hypothetical protein
MKRFFLVSLVTIWLAGCSASGEADPPVPAPSVNPLASPAPSQAPPSPAPAARHEKVSSKLIDFDYAYPAQAAAIAPLKGMFDGEIARRRLELLRQAKESQREAQRGDYPFNPLGYWAEWQVVTDLPGWLSLSALIGSHLGGAHPNYGYETVLWDRKANRRRDPLDLFASKQALADAIREPFCKELDRQRADKRGGEVRLGGGVTEFYECIDPVENTIILGSSSRRAFDRIGVLVAPYAAGPYAEGSYEVTLPVTSAVLAVVRPEFRLDFAVKR